jgi:predicted Zn-dependent peptidase
MGKSLLYFNHYDSLETLIAKIEAFTPSRLRDLANQVFHPDNLSTLIYR